MVAVSKDNEQNEICGAITSFKTAEGSVVFLTQAKSYYHRGPAFVNYSQLEFECIIQLQDIAESENKSTKVCRCKPRPSFTLGSNYRLYTSHIGVI
jgi:hypothetical protein